MKFSEILKSVLASNKLTNETLRLSLVRQARNVDSAQHRLVCALNELSTQVGKMDKNVPLFKVYDRGHIVRLASHVSDAEGEVREAVNMFWGTIEADDAFEDAFLAAFNVIHDG